MILQFEDRGTNAQRPSLNHGKDALKTTAVDLFALSERPKQNPCLREQTGVLEFNLDDDLLSHGETPHYHRRCIVSLLSSGWDQVVPMLYGRQEIRVLSRDLMASLQQIGYVIAFGVL